MHEKKCLPPEKDDKKNDEKIHKTHPRMFLNISAKIFLVIPSNSVLHVLLGSSKNKDQQRTDKPRYL